MHSVSAGKLVPDMLSGRSCLSHAFSDEPVSTSSQHAPTMISVILIADKSDAAAVETLGTLVEAVADGVLRDATLIGSPSDSLDRVADAAGAARIVWEGARDEMIKRAATQAKSDWLLIMTAGCVPMGAWISALAEFPATAETAQDAGFLPLQARRGLAASLSAVWINAKARLIGRADPRHGLLVRKSGVMSGARLRLVMLDGGILDRRH